MKIEVTRQHAYSVAVVFVILASIVLVTAYGTSQPVIMGHSVLEIDWNGALPFLTVTGTTTFNGPVCIGGVCLTTWPSGGTSLPTCGNGQVVKYNTTTSQWTCGNDIDTDTDTKCSTPGACSSVCIGSVCKSSWPGVSKDCPSGQYVTGMDANGNLKCDTPSGGGGSMGTSWQYLCNVQNSFPQCAVGTTNYYFYTTNTGKFVCTVPSPPSPSTIAGIQHGIAGCSQGSSCSAYAVGTLCSPASGYSEVVVSGSICGQSYNARASVGTIYRCT